MGRRLHLTPVSQWYIDAPKVRGLRPSCHVESFRISTGHCMGKCHASVDSVMQVYSRDTPEKNFYIFFFNVSVSVPPENFF